MALEIFKLIGSILVDTDAAEKSIKKTDEKAGNLGKTLLNGVKGAGKFAAGLTGAATAAAAGMVKMADDAATAMDVIDKASQRMNISAESYQELAHAASLSGVEMTTMEKAAKALEGTDLSLDDAINQIYAFETAEERSAAALELFGEKVAYDLSPMLNASADDMAAMRQEAHDLGLVMSQDTVTAGAALNDAMSNVKDSISALGTNLGTQLMPVVTEGCNIILDFMPTLQGIVGQIGPALSDVLSTILPVLLELGQKLIPPILTLVEALLPLFTSLCEAILPLITKLIEKIVDVLSKYVIPAVTKVVEVVKVAVDKVIDFFSNFKENMANIWEGIKNVFKGPINAIIGFINGMVSGVVKGINTMIGAMNKLKWEIPDWVPLLGGKTFGFDIKEIVAPQIPLLAKGGTVTGEGSAIVGEAGPELISLPRGASVNPLSNGSDISMVREILEKLYSEMPSLIAEGMNKLGIEVNERELGRWVKEYAG